MNPAVPLVFDAPKKSMPPQHWVDLSYDQQVQALSEVNFPAFRAKQINKQFYQRYQLNPLTMSDLPLAAREILTEKFFPTLLIPVRTLTVDDGSTTKILWKLHDGTLLESVIMRYPDRITLCISSQAGCGMACPFCATGQGGLQRNLSKAEIVEQVREAAHLIQQESGAKRRLSNIVFMGMGEPLANYSRVIAAIREITSLERFGISARSVTLSTVGVVPAIYKLREENLALTLAVSLHAPDDELRDTLVPINNRWKIAEVMQAMRDYAQHSGRRISIEYALIKEVNDQEFRGKLLGKLLAENLGSLAHVNVIPLNPTPGSQWDASPAKIMEKFVHAVRSYGISCTIRQTRGQEIAAACGQLAALERS